LPETLDETYDRILNSIPGENKESAVRILQFLTYSERPLSVAEAVDAIAVDINEKPNFDPKHRMPDPDEILIYCSSLVVIVPMLVNVDDRLIDDEDSDKNSEKDENSDKIQPDAQKAPGKHMKTMFVLQLAHFSVKEYLTSNRFYGPLSSELHETTARVSIAVVCLSYLLQFDRYLSHRKIVAEFPFANYCAVSWLHHAAAVEEESSEIMDLIGRLFCYNPAAYRVCYRLYCPDTASESSRRDKGTTRPAPALYYAAMGNLYSMVKLLIDNGADVNAKGGLQSYALHIASKQGHERIVQLLIERGANVSAFGGRHQYNALMEASSEGHTLIIKRLLERGMDVNAQNANNSHALEVAAASAQEHSQTLQLLLDSGAYDTRTVDCRSAVEKASMCGHSEAVELLLERGADIYKKHTIFVEEALEVACRARNERIIKLLLNKGTGMYATSHVWELFHEEVIRDRQVTAKALLEGAYIALKGNVPRNYGTVVNFCARLGRTYLLRLIYENFETDTYVSEPYGRTPLHLAAEGGHIESFEYLIGLGADPTVLDAKGDGILCYAAVGGNFEMVNTILNKTLGSERYSIHWSPLHWACRAGQAEIVKLLLEKSLYSHLITTDDLEGQLSPLDVVTYAGQSQMLKHLPITSRLLLGFHPGSERYSSERFEIPNVCKGCQLVSSHNLRSGFVDIRLAVLWAGLPVSHMQWLVSRQRVLRIRRT
jgi:ankyrin repeat protein